MLWPASSGPPCTVVVPSLAEKEAAPPPASTRVVGVIGLPVFVPPAWV